MSMLLRDVYEMAVRCFREIGSPSPEADAETLIEYYFECDRTYVMMHFTDPFDEARCDGFFRLMDLRANGTPVQHITGRQEFMGLPFKTSPEALIPRQDTENLVGRVLSRLEEKKPPFGGFEALDLCTGSGCIAVSIARLATKKVHMTASDLSEDALRLARENAERNGADVKFVQGDLFEPFPRKKNGEARHPFDVIVSNPPYIATSVLETLRPEVKDHEPRMALDGGPDGLDFYVRIFREAPFYLKQGGLLALEIGSDQASAVRALSDASGAFDPLPAESAAAKRYASPSGGTDPYIFPDLAGLDRVWLGIRK
ncbi:MAG: peptide chain release factor N(5)-glutamine methyltransferase [Firmicutes bacterium]|nr:peptide chain release factor N(5)-glutamine methyltransferase [Bacillota bacterium]